MRSRGFLRGPLAKRIEKLVGPMVAQYIQQAPPEELLRLTKYDTPEALIAAEGGDQWRQEKTNAPDRKA